MITDTIIEFVGLCVFTTQVLGTNATARYIGQPANLNPSIVIGIMPTVPLVSSLQKPAPLTNKPMGPSLTHAGDPIEQPSSARAAIESHPIVTGPQIEAHTAMLAFKSCDLLSVNGWAIKKLDDNGWLYLELTGEHLSFVADSPNASVTPDLSTLPLHHLGDRNALTEPYNPPHYYGAAAVFTISNGLLSACGKAASDGSNDTHRRIDTTLTLHTVSSLTITAAGSQKSVTFRAGARIMAGNVPLSFAQTGVSSANAHDHYKVYCAMTGVNTCDPPWITAMPGNCGDDAYRSSEPQAPHVFKSADFACSNTQWP